MNLWQIHPAYGIENLRQVEAAEPRAGAGEIVVAMKAASLNYRDLLTVLGVAGQFPLPLVPFSDGAGEVIEVGAGVTRVQPGDKVCPMFFQSWLPGPGTAGSRKRAGGGGEPQSRAGRSAAGGAAAADAARGRRRGEIPPASHVRRSGDLALRGAHGVARGGDRGPGRPRRPGSGAGHRSEEQT